MAETRDFPTPVVASVVSGILLCPFSDMHECAEYVLGHPVWTHQFPTLRHDMQRAVLAQHPGLPAELAGVNRDNWQEHARRLIEQFGPTLRLEKGAGLTRLLPTDGIPDHLKDKTIVVGTTKEAEGR